MPHRCGFEKTAKVKCGGIGWMIVHYDHYVSLQPLGVMELLLRFLVEMSSNCSLWSRRRKQQRPWLLMVEWLTYCCGMLGVSWGLRMHYHSVNAPKLEFRRLQEAFFSKNHIFQHIHPFYYMSKAPLLFKNNGSIRNVYIKQIISRKSDR